MAKFCDQLRTTSYLKLLKDAISMIFNLGKTFHFVVPYCNNVGVDIRSESSFIVDSFL